MPSTLTWLDSSEHDRRRALDVVDLFTLRDTRDELGLAGVRDAWADRLVPGTSTIQTRARYFLFVPWTYQALDRGGWTAGDVEGAARRRELELVDAISATDTEGVPIGARAGKGLKRLPSSIYWSGLGRLGIRLWAGSQAAFHRAFATWEQDPWHPHLPAPPEDYPERAVLRLREEEAIFLRDQVRVHATGSLLAFLMELDGYEEGADLPWEHPLRAELPRELAAWLDHAEAFAVLMHGSALLYNRMLAERPASRKRNDLEGLVEHYEERIREWSRDVDAWRSSTGGWDRGEFWRLTREIAPRLPGTAESFCEAWIERVLDASSPAVLLDDARARDLVERRETRLKGPRSRLRHPEHLERWGGAAGVARIDYRWGITQRLVRDVQEGLGQA